MTAAIVFCLVCAYADFATTRIGFKNGFREGNPFVRYALNKLPFDSEIELAALKLFAVAVLLAMGAPAFAFVAVGVVWLLAAVWNFRLLRKERVL